MNKQRIVSFLIGVLFLISGGLKAIDSLAFSQLFANYGFSFFAYLSPVISAIEIVIGVCLILFIQPAKTSLITAILTIVFTIAFAYAYLVNGIKDCGCFGTLIKNIPPYVSFIRNILIIVGSVWVWRSYKNKNMETSSASRWTVYVIGALGFCLSGHTVSAPLLKEENLVSALKGKMLQETVLQPFVEKLPGKKNAIFIFSPTCSHCWNATENVKTLVDSKIFSNVIGITFSSIAKDTTAYIHNFKTNFKIHAVPNELISKTTKKIPVLLLIDDGKITNVYEGLEIPCAQTLNHFDKPGNR